jgi:DNA helicase-2/ATP-dependent DNA helicase PcrA
MRDPPAHEQHQEKSRQHEAVLDADDFVLACLQGKGVNAVLVQRRENFISPQFVWLQACLDQIIRPTNKRQFTIMVNSANRIINLELDPLILIAEAEAAGHSLMEHWGMVVASIKPVVGKQLGKLVEKLVQSRSNWKEVVKTAIPILLETAKVAEGAVCAMLTWVNRLARFRNSVRKLLKSKNISF